MAEQPEITKEIAMNSAGHCIKCGVTDLLYMFPFRLGGPNMWDGHVVGFFFICEHCIPTVRGKKFWFDFVDEKEDTNGK